MTQPAGPPNVQEAIKAFKDAQEQRVNHWKEYDEAIAIFTAQQESTHSDRRNGSMTTPMTNGTSSGHYQSEALPMTEDIFTKIVSLVTSGLLDSSHIVRAIETELRTRFHEVQLADLVGKVQDLENKVLRNIVQRDQIVRSAQLEGRQEDHESINRYNHEVQDYREEIQELMSEINAEVAELTAQ